mgnify:CR=1 FL=1
MDKQTLLNVAEAATWAIPATAGIKIGWTLLKGVNTYRKFMHSSRRATGFKIKYNEMLLDKKLKDIGERATKNVNSFLKIPNPTTSQKSSYVQSQKVLNQAKEHFIKETKTANKNLILGSLDTKTNIKNVLIREKLPGVIGDVGGSTGAYMYLTKNKDKK